MALPSGVDSTEFLEKSGWFDIADETLACLLIMKPENGTWGSAEDELAYVDAGYGHPGQQRDLLLRLHLPLSGGLRRRRPRPCSCGPPRTPWKMISQVYVDAQVDAAYDALLEAAPR